MPQKPERKWHCDICHGNFESFEELGQHQCCEAGSEAYLKALIAAKHKRDHIRDQVERAKLGLF